MLTVALLAACERKPAEKPVETPADPVTVATLDTTPKPLFAFCHNARRIQMIYGDLVDSIVEPLRQDADQYTRLYMSPDECYEVRYVDETLTDSEGNLLSPGEIHLEKYPAPGLNYALTDKTAFKAKGYDMEFGLLVAEDYLASHPLLKIAPAHGDMPKELVEELEKKYQMEANFGSWEYAIGEHGYYGVLQFKHKGDEITALEVYYDGTKSYTLAEVGRYYEPEGEYEPISYWNVEDDGFYMVSQLFEAFEGPQGVELYYVRYAAESCTCGVLCTRPDGSLVRNQQAYYYYMTMMEASY